MIHQYLAELAKIQLLMPAEEHLLWKQFKNENSRDARYRLIESYQPLVYKIASRLTDREDLFLDLLQEGTIGLIEAVENFNPQRAVKFSTFAPHRIRGRMIDFLKRQHRAHDSLEVALKEEELAFFLAQVADEQVDIEEEVSVKLLGGQVKEAIARLSPKEQKVIQDLYLLDKEPVTSAREMNVSLSYLYKLQKKALQRLRGMLSKLRAELKIND